MKNYILKISGNKELAPEDLTDESGNKKYEKWEGGIAPYRSNFYLYRKKIGNNIEKEYYVCKDDKIAWDKNPQNYNQIQFVAIIMYFLLGVGRNTLSKPKKGEVENIIKELRLYGCQGDVSETNIFPCVFDVKNAEKKTPQEWKKIFDELKKLRENNTKLDQYGEYSPYIDFFYLSDDEVKKKMWQKLLGTDIEEKEEFEYYCTCIKDDDGSNTDMIQNSQEENLDVKEDISSVRHNDSDCTVYIFQGNVRVRSSVFAVACPRYGLVEFEPRLFGVHEDYVFVVELLRGYRADNVFVLQHVFGSLDKQDLKISV